MRSSVLLIIVLFFVLADLKRICETENGSLEIRDNDVQQILKKTGLATQCIQAKNAIKCNNMTLAQICLKINSKMGGANNAIFSNIITRLVSLSYLNIFLVMVLLNLFIFCYVYMNILNVFACILLKMMYLMTEELPFPDFLNNTLSSV